MAEAVSIEETLRKFSTEQACIEALYAAKWPNGFRCARCGCAQAYKITSRRLPIMECKICRYQESLIAGTVMEGSKSSLRQWFHSIILVSLQASSVNAVQLSAAIGVTYKTAWLILHKLRHAMSQADAGKLLSGMVKINTTAYGKPHNPSVLRHPQEQPLLVGASVGKEGKPLYIKIKQISENCIHNRSVSPAGTRLFIERQIESGTDDIEVITGRFSPGRFRKLLEEAKGAGRWINEVFRGIGPKYLQAYLDEYCCRRNQMNREGSMLSYFIGLCAANSPITYPALKLLSN
jgi:hypothetical protein